MGESKTTRAAASKDSKEHLFPTLRERRSGKNFGTIVRALWPDKPALNLAQRMGVSERNALQIIRGERRVTARALHVVNAEMLD